MQLQSVLKQNYVIDVSLFVIIVRHNHNFLDRREKTIASVMS